MSPRDIFGILVRTAGLWLLVQSAILVSAIFASPILIVALIVESGLGCLLLLGADRVVGAAYDLRPDSDA